MGPKLFDLGQITPSRCARTTRLSTNSEDDDDDGDGLQVESLPLRQKPHHRLDRAKTEQERPVELPLREEAPGDSRLRSLPRTRRQRRRVFLAGFAATAERVPAQSGQRMPTGVRTLQRGQIGRPQREQRRRVSTSGWSAQGTGPVLGKTSAIVSHDVALDRLAKAATAASTAATTAAAAATAAAEAAAKAAAEARPTAPTSSAATAPASTGERLARRS